MNLSCWEDGETFPRIPACLWWARPGETSKCWIHTPHTDRGVLEQIWSDVSLLSRTELREFRFKMKNCRRHKQKSCLKESRRKEESTFACVLALDSEPLETHLQRLASVCFATPPTHRSQDPISHPPLLHEMNGESENLVPAMLDSGRHRSSCNIWWLGRGVGLELGKLLWHPCPHEKQPSTTASSWSFCTTQTDSCRSGWDQESSNGKTPGGPGPLEGVD